MLGRVLRPIIAKIFTPLAKALMAIGVSADLVTIAGTIITSLLAIIFIPNGHLLLGGFLIGVFALFDSLDGIIARLAGKSGPWGAYLDSTLDRITDGAVFGSIIIFFINRINIWTCHAQLAPGYCYYGAMRWWPTFGLPLGTPATFGGTQLDFWTAIAALVCLVLGGVVPYARARAGAFGLDPKSGFFERATRLLFALVPLGFMQIPLWFHPTTLAGMRNVAVAYTIMQWVLLAALVTLAIGSAITIFQRMSEVKRALAGQYFAQTTDPVTEQQALSENSDNEAG